MAKLPKTGVTYSSLYEKDCTLAEVIKNLGLKSLSRKAERQIRDRLGFALGTWEAPHPPFVIKDIVRLLNSYAKCLKALEKLGTIARAGFASEDEIVVGGELVQILASEPAIGSVKGAHAYLKDFSDRAGTLSSACRLAARNLQSKKGKSGKPRFNWYDDFTAVLLEICANNGIEPTVGVDDVSGAARGGLAQLASGFEPLTHANGDGKEAPTQSEAAQRKTTKRRRLKSLKAMARRRTPCPDSYPGDGLGPSP